MSDPVSVQQGGNTGTIGQPMVLQVGPRVFRVRLTGMLFDTDKCFLLPRAMNGVRGLKKIYDGRPGLQVLVVGHADRVGDAEYNRKLSVERARAIAEFLQDRVDDWLAFYSGRPGSATWGATEDHKMLGALGFTDVSSYQTARGLDVDGSAGPDTRRALVTDYMAQDETSLPASAHLETHGCGEANPEIPTGDGVADERNRRVEVFLFEEAIDPAPADPCPQPGGCEERQQWVGRSVETIDLSNEPGGLDVTVVDTSGQPVAGAAVHLSSLVPEDGIAGPDGVARFPDLIPTDYEAFAQQDGFTSASAPVQVTPGETQAVTLVIEARGHEVAFLAHYEISVSEAKEDSHIPQVDFTVERPGTEEEMGEVVGAGTADAAGEGRVPVPEPGEYVVRFGTPFLTDVEIEVLEGDTGEPLAGTSVQITDVDGRVSNETTSGDGKLTLAKIATGLALLEIAGRSFFLSIQPETDFTLIVPARDDQVDGEDRDNEEFPGGEPLPANG